MDPDISIWQKTGHFYFALTRVFFFLKNLFYEKGGERRRGGGGRGELPNWGDGPPIPKSFKKGEV